MKREDNFNKQLKASEKRVIKYIKKVVTSECLTLNEYTLNTMEKTNGNLGSCRHKKMVFIQKSLLDSGVEKDIDSVVAHEITHCIAESRGHDKLWKSIIKSINEIAPFEIYQFSNSTLSENESLQSNFKYVCKCNACNKAIFMNKKESAQVRNYKRYNGYWNSHCPNCGADKSNIEMEW